MWQGLPVLVVVLAGGFTTNFVWCAVLHLRNRSYGEYLRIPTVRTGTHQMPSLLENYLFSALAGVTWYMQFFFYTMGETQMGRYKFSSWTLHMASIIIFSTLWGIALKEWRGVSVRTRTLVFLTLLTLVGSTLIVGYGNYLGLK
jgi:L-rhamnose-H+ transport protein